MAEVAEQGPVRLVHLPRARRSRWASSASSMLSVMTPSAWPVTTRGPPGGARSRSKARPPAGPPRARVATGSPSSTAARRARRLALSMRCQSWRCRRATDRESCGSSGRLRQRGPPAERRAVLVDEPVAGRCRIEVGATAVLRDGAGRRAPDTGPPGLRHERDDTSAVAVVAERAAASQAAAVAEENRTAAHPATVVASDVGRQCVRRCLPLAGAGSN